MDTDTLSFICVIWCAVQPKNKNNAWATSVARGSCGPRLTQWDSTISEGSLLCFCVLPTGTFVMQEDENLTAKGVAYNMCLAKNEEIFSTQINRSINQFIH